MRIVLWQQSASNQIKMTAIDMTYVASDRLFDYYEVDFETDSTGYATISG